MFERRSDLVRLPAVADAERIVTAADRLAMTQPAHPPQACYRDRAFAPAGGRSSWMKCYDLRSGNTSTDRPIGPGMAPERVRNFSASTPRLPQAPQCRTRPLNNRARLADRKLKGASVRSVPKPTIELTL